MYRSLHRSNEAKLSKLCRRSGLEISWIQTRSTFLNGPVQTRHNAYSMHLEMIEWKKEGMREYGYQD